MGKCSPLVRTCTPPQGPCRRRLPSLPNPDQSTATEFRPRALIAAAEFTSSSLEGRLLFLPKLRKAIIQGGIHGRARGAYERIWQPSRPEYTRAVFHVSRPDGPSGESRRVPHKPVESTRTPSPSHIQQRPGTDQAFDHSRNQAIDFTATPAAEKPDPSLRPPSTR